MTSQEGKSKRGFDGWLSAGRTRNFLLSDPILDWLKRYGKLHGYVPDNEHPSFDAATDFTTFVMAKGRAFEEAVLANLKRRFDVETITTTRDEIGSPDGVARTIDAMRRGVAFIAQGTLRDEASLTFGAPDLLVRSDALLRLTPTAFDVERVWRKENDRSLAPAEIAVLPAPTLGTAFHYRVVDIKFTGLHLDRKGHAGNHGSMTAYKGQVWLYNQMLGRAQGLLPPAGFLLGRSWEKGSTDSTYEEGRACFDRLGAVFNDGALRRGLLIEEGVAAALSWLRRMSTDGATWQAGAEPSTPELRPNMKNKQDGPWHGAKREIAEAQRELTQLWQVGVELRDRALAGEVSDGSGGTWPRLSGTTDARLNAATLGVTKPSAIKALDMMLEINRAGAGTPTAPQQVSINEDEWRERKRLELFVDFETVNDLDDNFALLPERGGQPLIFMIGVGQYVAEGAWSFRCFVADRLTVAAERQMLGQFFAHLDVLKKAAAAGDSDVRVFHWSPAEESVLDTAWTSARSRHPQSAWPPVPWYDFLNRVVKKEPFVVRGAYGFGLKAIGKALHKLGLIATSWSDGPTDGMGAMVAAWSAEAEAARNGGTLLQVPRMAEVVTYNEVDCRVMAEVIGFVRGKVDGALSAERVTPTATPSLVPMSPLETSVAAASTATAQVSSMKIISGSGERAIDELRAGLARGDSLDVVTPALSLPAFSELQDLVKGVKRVRFAVPGVTPDALRLFGDDGDRSWRNKLQQRAVARKLADWIEDAAEVRTTNGTTQAMMSVRSSTGPELALTGTASFTTSGLGVSPPMEMPFVQVFQGAAESATHARYFDSMWDRLSAGPQIKEQLLATLRGLDEPTAPALVYFLILYHLFKDLGDDLDEDRIVNSATGIRDTAVWRKLFRFQRDGVIGAIDKLQKYGGCIIADSVGLGKTFEALAVIKYHELRNDRVLVLCPKRLRDNWTLYKANDRRNVLADDRFHYDVLNHTDLTRESGLSGDIDLSNVKWGNYDLVVIDESHNFRNKPANKGKESRYDRLMQAIIKSGVKTRVLMLSATPVNNRLADLKNQIAFATEGNDLALAEKGIASIEKTTRLAQLQFNRWLDMDEDAGRTPSRLIEMLGFDYFKLLDLLTIARSRKHIERYYGTKETGRFPERLKPVNIWADVDSAGAFKSIKEINDEIRRLNLSAYSPLQYVLPHKRPAYDEKYATNTKDGKVLWKQADREQNLIHLLRVNLLKRMESAVTSFKLTLQRQLDDVVATLAKLTAGGDVDGPSIEDIDVDDPLFESLLVGRSVKVALADVDKIRWRQDLELDRDRLERLLAAATEVNAARDAKLARLKDQIRKKVLEPLNPGNKKVLVFSAFADTAEHLYDHLHAWALDELGIHTALVTGAGRNRTTMSALRSDLSSILTAFSPRSKERPGELAVDGELDLLIATDCISEGQNLQDCDTVINYDIHWNPVRIIQRFGRIDRIGSQNKVVQLVNFWPNIELEEYIDLERRVAGRMVLLDVSATGEENLIDNADKQAMNDLDYRRRQLLKLKDAVIDMEDLSSGISISDLTLGDFRMDLARFLKEEGDVLEHRSLGTFAVTTTTDATAGVPAGTIFCLRACGEAATKVAEPGYPLSPHFLVHVGTDGASLLPYTQAKQVLDRLKRLCINAADADTGAWRRFDDATRGGEDMGTVQRQLATAVAAVTGKKEERAVASLFSPGGTHAKKGEFAGTNDFEVVAYVVVLPGASA